MEDEDAMLEIVKKALEGNGVLAQIRVRGQRYSSPSTLWTCRATEELLIFVSKKPTGAGGNRASNR